jgi:hypothetical protein
MVDVVAAGRDLKAAQVELDRCGKELTAYVETASALDAVLFRRGLDARQERVREAEERVRHLSARSSRLPVGGPLSHSARRSASKSRSSTQPHLR